jgi:Type IV Pilus-assembly protein W
MQAGISLVETLVALVLGLAMVSVAFNLFVSNRGVFRQIEAMVRLQESASIATTLLETSIRHAGGTLCRNNPPTTILLNASSPYPYAEHRPTMPYAFWESNDVNSSALMGLHGYESITSDPIVGDNRLAGDSISIMSDNMGAIARVTGPAIATSASFGFSGTYNFPVDYGLDFPLGTVAMACDQVRAVLFQVNGTNNKSRIRMQAGGSTTPTPGNCAVTMRRDRPYQTDPVSALNGQWSCANGPTALAQQGQMYTFGPGSMIGEHTFEHWYIGRKTNTTDGLSLFRRRMGYDTSGNVKLLDAEEIVQDVTDMQITYLPGVLYTGYPQKSYYVPANDPVTNDGIANYDRYTFRSVTAVRIVLTFTSPDRVGWAASAATNAASAATYTIPINVAIRARMPGVVRR